MRETTADPISAPDVSNVIASCCSYRVPSTASSATRHTLSPKSIASILAAASSCMCGSRCLPFHTLLLLLYGTGMRIGEALSLTFGEVDLANRLLTITDSKFFKTRLPNHRL